MSVDGIEFRQLGFVAFDQTLKELSTFLELVLKSLSLTITQMCGEITGTGG
jgi:hypothetical protein